MSANARRLPTLGDRAFQSAAPKLWTSLPVEIRNIQTLTSFKRALKTYFLRQLLIDLFIRSLYILFIHTFIAIFIVFYDSFFLITH